MPKFDLPDPVIRGLVARIRAEPRPLSRAAVARARTGPAARFTPLRRRIARLIILAAGAALYFTLAALAEGQRNPRCPRPGRAPGGRAFTSATLLGPQKWSNGRRLDAQDQFRFPGGSAPRVVTHEPRARRRGLRRGDRDPENLHAQSLECSDASLSRGGPTSLDVSEAVAAAVAQ